MTVGDEILDNIIHQMGGIGKHQIMVLSCLTLVAILQSATHFAYVFTSMDTDYRCSIPGCEDELVANPDLLENMVPYNYLNKPKKCLMYSKIGGTAEGNCSSSTFNKSLIVECSTFHFNDEEFFIAREFNLLCEDKRWALSLVGTTNTIGMFLGLLVTGFISDKYGRKRLLLFGVSGCGFLGLMKTLSPSFMWFLMFELLEAMSSAGTCACLFIIGLELVVPEKRALIGSFLSYASTFGEVLIAIIAWSCKSWRSLIYLAYGPCALVILLYCVLPESLRWMLSKDKLEESKEALRNMAKMNGKHLTEDTLNKLHYATVTAQTTIKFSDIYRSPRLFWRFSNCCFGWVTCAFLFYGIIMNSVSLYGNKYLDFTLLALAELPAYWYCNYVVDKFGRRTSLCFSYLITSLACICFVFISESSPVLYLFTYCLGKFGATAAFFMIYIITSESFPTPLRHSTMGICSTIGRFGSMSSPQIPLLAQVWTPLPMVMFATMAGIAGLLSLFLPETKGIKLPDTIEEAENIS